MDILKKGITNLSAIQLGAGLIGATATVLYFGISNPIGWLIVSVGALAELVSVIFPHFFFGWMWSKIAPVFSDRQFFRPNSRKLTRCLGWFSGRCFQSQSGRNAAKCDYDCCQR